MDRKIDLYRWFGESSRVPYRLNAGFNQLTLSENLSDVDDSDVVWDINKQKLRLYKLVIQEKINRDAASWCKNL